MKYRTTISLDPDLKKQVQKLADKNHRSFSAMVNFMLHSMINLPSFMGGFDENKGKYLKEDLNTMKKPF